MNSTLRYAAHSDRGLVRDGNQDAVYAGPRLLAVADGMGGMAAGDVASSIVIAAMAPLDEDVPGDDLLDPLRTSVESANQQLRETVDANPQLEGMGTTLTALLFAGSRAGLVHIGDSRAYLLRDGEFSQITKDDTYVQMLVDEGRISSEEAGSHPQRSLLTRAMDGRDLDPEYSVRPVLPGDRYLICSDGLSGVVSEETIAETLREQPDPQGCVERLVALALRGGGPDNVTVIVADTTDEDIVEATPIVGGAAARADGGGSADPPTVPVAVAPESTPAARASALNPPPGGAPPAGGVGGAPPGPPPPGGGPVGAPTLAAPPDIAVGTEPVATVQLSASAAPARKPRRALRLGLLLAGLLAVLAGGLFAGWTLTQSSYYVGVTPDDEIAVFRGYDARVAGLDLYQLHQGSGVHLRDLREEVQDDVRNGCCRAGSAEDAVDEMERLIQNNRQEVQDSDPVPTEGPEGPPGPGGSAGTPSPPPGDGGIGDSVN